MVGEDVLKRAAEWRDSFETADPFKHVAIENFLPPVIAEALLREFPRFDRDRARNEFGAPSGKHVVTNMGSISPAYAELYGYLRGPKFLSLMSEITGIPDLLFDDAMYGGGTHENVDGQELDPHVDFNVDQKTGWHRRLNALLYLNHEWDESWGGCLQLHKNPRDPDEDRVITFLPLFNRLVIFETNEYSWHGFERIRLPADRKSESRKCISIYLYTRTRPQEETVASHGTFYVQRPLPSRFQPGYVLTADDVRELKTATKLRDSWIEAYQKGTIRSSQEILNQKESIAKAQSNQRVGIQADVRQLTGTRNVSHDGWLLAPSAEMSFASSGALSSILLNGQVHAGRELKRATVISGNRLEGVIQRVADGYQVTFETPFRGQFQLLLEFVDGEDVPASGDKRKLAFLLRSIKFA
jgi:hypothetical protein